MLSESGFRIAVIELEGTIFFGTAEALGTKAESLADEGTDFVIFDMKRVHGVDATGFKVLGQTFARLRDRGTTLGFSYVQPGVLRSEVAEDLILNGVPEARLWVSTDRALEYFEEGLLFKLGADEFDEEGAALSAPSFYPQRVVVYAQRMTDTTTSTATATTACAPAAGR